MKKPVQDVVHVLCTITKYITQNLYTTEEDIHKNMNIKMHI